MLMADDKNIQSAGSQRCNTESHCLLQWLNVITDIVENMLTTMWKCITT